MNSALSLNELYRKIIEEFGKRLLEKYNQKQQGFDAQMVDQLKNLMFSKLQRTDLLFSKALQIKHGATSNQLVIDKKISGVSQIKRQQVEPHREGEEDIIDYADIFDKQEVEVKKEEGDQNGIIKHEPNQDLQDEKDEEDQKQKKQKVAKIKNNLATHIVGTYEPRAKKHVARDQSTTLTLENVFIKTKAKDQIYVPKLTCQFRKQ